ncbi:MAG: hemerythrin domain-containing protein [Myxococcales bacterium]|nr:hemerythrin domain-containing protein [Myxococcales bacterium]
MRLRDLRKQLLEQHAQIRRLVGQVEAGLDARLGAGEVTGRLDALKAAVVAHNQLEAHALEPILECIDAWGPQRVKALVGEHRAEHEGVLTHLGESAAKDGAKLRTLLAELVAHLAQEEKTLLTEKLLRDDVIQLDAGD